MNLVFRIKMLIKNRGITPVLLIPQKLHFLTQWQIEKPLALTKYLVHELLAYSMIHHVEKPTIQTSLNPEHRTPPKKRSNYTQFTKSNEQ